MKKLFASCLVFLLLTGCGQSGSKDVSGEIHVYTRDASSGTREAFEKGIDFEQNLTKEAIEVTSNDDMAAKVGADINGIGYTSLSTDFEKNKVVPVIYQGVEASTKTVLDGSYQLQRPFKFVTRASGDYESEDKQALIKAFLDFLQNSTEGMAIVAKNGGEVDTTKGVAWSQLAINHPITTKDNQAITIVTCGSTSVEKTLKAALEAFSPMAGNFKIIMNQNGSSDAYKRVLGNEKDGANRADIGFASREFKEEEDVTKAMMSGTYCIDAVVAIVNKDNTAYQQFTQQQLYAIFTGQINQWEEVK